MNQPVSSSAPGSQLLLDAAGFATILDERLPFAELMGLAVDAFAEDHVLMRAV